MANDPLVSVIIPAYNAGSYIDEALRSVLDQDYPELEVIVIDDGSADDTAERIAAFSERVRCPEKSRSAGYPGVPRNTGIAHARGDYLCFLDADDVMCPGRIRRQTDLLGAQPQVGAVFSNYRNFTRAGASQESHFETCTRLWQKLGAQSSVVMTGDVASGLLLQENFGIPSTLMIRREVLSRVPGFSCDLQTSEDFHFFFRIARYFSIGIIRELGAHRRLHESNVTNDTLRTLGNYIASRSDLRRSETDSANLALLDRFLCNCEIGMAREYANRREFEKSLTHNLRALSGAMTSSGAYIGPALKTLLRTAAIATRLKRPCP